MPRRIGSGDGERKRIVWRRVQRSASRIPKFLRKFQQRNGPSQLRECLGLCDVAGSIPESFLCTFLRCESCGLVHVMRADRRVGKHRDLVGLHFDRPTADEEGLLRPFRRLHAYFSRL